MLHGIDMKKIEQDRQMRTCSTPGVFFVYNENSHPSTSQPSLIQSQNKMKRPCMPSCPVRVRSLKKIGPCMSEKWLETRLSNKMAAWWPSWIALR